MGAPSHGGAQPGSCGEHGRGGGRSSAGGGAFGPPARSTEAATPCGAGAWQVLAHKRVSGIPVNRGLWGFPRLGPQAGLTQNQDTSGADRRAPGLSDPVDDAGRPDVAREESMCHHRAPTRPEKHSSDTLAAARGDASMLPCTLTSVTGTRTPRAAARHKLCPSARPPRPGSASGAGGPSRRAVLGEEPLRQTLELLRAQIPSWQHSVSHACFVFAVCEMVMLTISCSLVSVHWRDV